MDKQPGGSMLMQFLSHVADLMTVNILWFVCSIPVFTAGAATTAMYTVTMKLLKGEGAPVSRTFFQAFRANFKKGTLTWLIMLIPTVLIVLTVSAALLTADEAKIVRIICLVVAGIFWLACNFVYPLTAYFENTIRRTLLNALLMVFGDLPRAVLVGVYSAVPFAIYMVSPQFFMGTLIFWPILGMALIADLQSRTLQKVFARYLPKEDEEGEEGDEPQPDQTEE